MMRVGSPHAGIYSCQNMMHAHAAINDNILHRMQVVGAPLPPRPPMGPMPDVHAFARHHQIYQNTQHCYYQQEQHWCCSLGHQSQGCYPGAVPLVHPLHPHGWQMLEKVYVISQKLAFQSWALLLVVLWWWYVSVGLVVHPPVVDDDADMWRRCDDWLLHMTMVCWASSQTVTGGEKLHTHTAHIPCCVCV